MSSYTVIVSVLFLLLLGWLSRKSGWITLAQKDGALKIVFSIFFPFLVFNLLASVQLKLDVASMVILLLVLYGQFYYLGRTILSRWLSPYSEIGAFLLTTAEGGDMALPLYLSIVGAKSATAGYPILLDLAGMIFCFIIIPVLVCARQEKKVVPSRLVLDALHSPMIIAALLGLAANLTGFYDWMSITAFMPWYSSAISMVTSPIVPVVLFSVGYDFQLTQKITGPAVRCVLLRLVLFSGIIGLFFLFFPDRMHDPAFLMAALLYFTAPTGFGVLGQIQPLMKTEDQKEYASAVFTLNMAVTLMIFACCMIFYGSLGH